MSLYPTAVGKAGWSLGPYLMVVALSTVVFQTEDESWSCIFCDARPCTGKQSCKPPGNFTDSTRDHFREVTGLDNADLHSGKASPPARELPGGVLWPAQYWRSGCWSERSHLAWKSINSDLDEIGQFWIWISIHEFKWINNNIINHSSRCLACESPWRPAVQMQLKFDYLCN